MKLPLPPPRPERVAFFGTPDIAVPTLLAIHAAGFDVAVVVTGPDKRRGRGATTSPSPVKAAAQDLGLAVSTEISDVLATDRHGAIDMGVVVAFGRLIPRRVLEEVPMINLHFSALPRWRGAAPIERAILAGDDTTAVTVMGVAEALDEGDIWSQTRVDIGANETASGLAGRLAVLGADLVVETMQRGFPASVAQAGEPVYAAKISADDRRLDFDDTAETAHRVVRVGGVWTTFRGKRFKIWEAVPVDEAPPSGQIDGTVVGCRSGGLQLVTVQPEGKARMSAAEWVNGAQPEPAEHFDHG